MSYDPQQLEQLASVFADAALRTLLAEAEIATDKKKAAGESLAATDQVFQLAKDKTQHGYSRTEGATTASPE